MTTMIDLQPTKCNICNGKVIFASNSIVYGKEYGSGKCYFCTNCGAYVGTHKPRPREALGILANKEMRDMKMQCHELFDSYWKNESSNEERHSTRSNAYCKLAGEIGIPIEECHFGHFNLDMLNKAYAVLQKWEKNENE